MHCFLQRTGTRITCITAPECGGSKPDAPTIRENAGTDIYICNTPVVDMSPVNRLIEHMFTMLVFVRAERAEDWSLPLCAVENMILYYLPGHSFKVVRPTNHHSRVSATFLKSTLLNMSKGQITLDSLVR